MKTFSIHNHSTYSILDGVGTPEYWAEFISKNSDKFLPAISLSEHGTLNGILETYNAAKKYNLKYLPSCEIYMNNHFENDTKLTRYHLVLFAINRKGFDQLLDINNKTIQNNQIIKTRTGKRIPIVTTDIIKEVIGEDKGHLKCSGACIGGYWHLPITKIIQGRDKLEKEEYSNKLSDAIKKSKDHLEEIITIFGEDNVYLEYQTFPDNSQIIINKLNRKYKKDYNLKTIITSDAHVPRQSDIKYQVIVTSIGWKIPLNKYLQFNKPHESVWLKGYDDFLKEINEKNFEITKEELEESIQESINIFNMIEEFDLFKEQKFFYHDKSVEEKNILFKKLIKQGWEERIEKIVPEEKIPEYANRLRYEINILVKKNFIDYFLAVQEILELGREEGLIFGVGRGSAASSLVSYLLKITNLDPIKYNLVFERFISENRIDFPDIDIDVSNREKVIDIISRLYHSNDVAVVANKSKFGIKSLINNIFKVLNISHPKESYVESGYFYSDLLDKHGIDQYDLDTYLNLYEVKELSLYIKKEYGYDLKELMTILLKNLYAIGVHAGGVCILPKTQTDVPLTPVSNDKYPYGSGYSESGSYRELEYVGQIKFDFLGIRTLRVFEEVGKILQEKNILNKDEVKELLLFNNVDIEDENVYNKINTTLTDGIFQLGSSGIKEIISKLEPKNMEELSQLLALYRPGPLQAGMADTIIQMKNKEIKPEEMWSEDVLKIIRPIIESTHYHILYQEQIMLIGKTIGGYESKNLNDFRKFISKGSIIEKDKPELFKEWKKTFYESFIKKGLEKGISKESLEDLWNKMKKFSNYSFVKSHSVSYSYNTFMCSYLSYYYPAQWYTALLRHEDSVEFIPIIKEQIKILNQDIKIETPKINNIYAIPTLIDNNTIILGINQIKGIGPKAAVELENITSKFNSFEEFINSKEYSKRAINKGVVEKLISIGFFDNIESDRGNLLMKFAIIKAGKKINKDSINRENYLKELFNFNQEESLFFYQSEINMIGMAISEFPFKELVSKINNYMINEVLNKEVDSLERLKSSVILNVEETKVRKTKSGKEYLTIKMKTLSGKMIWCNVFSKNIKSLKEKQGIDLYKEKLFKGNMFIFYYTESKEWKNFKALVSLNKYL